MKKVFITLLVIIVCALGFYGEAAASSYLASQGGSKSISFGKMPEDKSIVRFGGVQTQITSTSNPADPMIGSWQSIFVGDHGVGKFPQTMYDYQLTKETSPGSGVWNLSGGEARIYITADKPKDETSITKAYFEATATATTVDFVKGIVTWSTVAVNNVNNPFGDATALNAFSQYATGVFTYTFATTESLRKWIADPTAVGITRTSSFATQLSSSTTAAPEPGTWALILVGIGLLSLGLRNKLHVVANAQRTGDAGILPA